MGKALEIEIDLSGFDKIIKDIEISKRDMMLGIGESMVTVAKDSFRNEGLMGTDDKWKPNKKGTTIMIDTGQLRNSIEVMQVENNSVTVGSPLVYAEPHNAGISPQPKRTFLEMNEYMEKEIIKDLEFQYKKTIEK